MHDTIRLLSALQFGNNNGMLTFKDDKQQNGRKYQRFKKFHILARVLIHVDLLFVQWVELPPPNCVVLGSWLNFWLFLQITLKGAVQVDQFTIQFS